MTRAKSKLIPKRPPEKAPRLASASAKAAPSAPKPASKLEALPRPARAAKPGAPPVPVPRADKAPGKAKLPVLKLKPARAAAVPSAAKVESAPPTKTKGAARAAANAKPVLVDTPAKIRPIEQAVGVSSDAVARRTGKSWAEWFALLDAAGAGELDHKGIVAVLAQRHGVGPWWQQMVTVAYEQARGKREKQDADEGYQVDVSKTLELPLAKLFRFWVEPAERNKWLADDRFSIHKATASKSIRARWGRGVSRIDVDFSDKGAGKSQVTVQHNRIESSDAAEQMKAYWAKKISALEALTRA
jgi:hypothetical protein